jgi:hypothetical protein
MAWPLLCPLAESFLYHHRGVPPLALYSMKTFMQTFCAFCAGWTCAYIIDELLLNQIGGSIFGAAALAIIVFIWAKTFNETD